MATFEATVHFAVPMAGLKPEPEAFCPYPRLEAAGIEADRTTSLSTERGEEIVVKQTAGTHQMTSRDFMQFPQTNSVTV